MCYCLTSMQVSRDLNLKSETNSIMMYLGFPKDFWNCVKGLLYLASPILIRKCIATGVIISVPGQNKTQIGNNFKLLLEKKADMWVSYYLYAYFDTPVKQMMSPDI